MKVYVLYMYSLLYDFLKKILFILERGEGREKERDRNIHAWLPLKPPAGDLACSPGMCPRLGIQKVFL